MIFNQANLQTLRTMFSGLFKKGRSKATPKFSILATPVASTTKTTTFGFFSEMPILREWIGDKRIKSLEERAYILVNRDFEGSVKIKVTDIEDDNLGLFPASVEDWGTEVEQWPERLLTAALIAGNAVPCYDNQNFFDASHPNFDEAGTTYSNNNTVGTVQAWYLVDLSKAIKPLIMQTRKPPRFWMTNSVEDSIVAETGKICLWAEARGNAGYSMPFLAYRSTATPNAANFVAARDAMAAFVDENGEPRGIKATHIVYGTSNRAAIEDLIKKMNLAGGESNVHWNEVECLYSERLP
ncbi:MAG: Mu-like prophage major head subunit gpT family protein [Sphingomonas sp.]